MTFFFPSKGYFKGLGKGNIPKTPGCAPARDFLKDAVRKIRAIGGISHKLVTKKK
jgi:hypothetical protein